MIEIIISIIYIFFLTQNINTIIEKRPKKYLLYILVDIVFYTTLIFFNHTNGISPIVESVFAVYPAGTRVSIKPIISSRFQPKLYAVPIPA